MKYTEWRDELKNNLLCVSESERKRVLDYYAEAYADRRSAGFSESEIIDGFGAPYDAAQAILDDNEAENFNSCGNMPRQSDFCEEFKGEKDVPIKADSGDASSKKESSESNKKGRTNILLFVILCIVMAGLAVGIFSAMFGLLAAIIVAPFTIFATGGGMIGGGVSQIVGGATGSGVALIGGGIIAVGLGVIVTPLLFKLLKFLFILCKKIFTALFNACKVEA